MHQDEPELQTEPNLLSVTVVDKPVHRKIISAYLILSLSMVWAFYFAHEQSRALVIWETHACHVRAKLDRIQVEYFARISRDQHRYRKVDTALTKAFDSDMAWVTEQRKLIATESCGAIK